MERDRRSTILQLVVDAYIQHAQPISSSTVARLRPDLGLSSATIRATMVELEEAGLLHQPHKSAGRVPTERGFRTYLDSLLSPKLHPWDRTRLEETAANTESADFPALLGQTLSGLSRQVAVVATPRFLGSRCREIGLVRCDAKRFLAYFVTPNGLVQQKLVEVSFDLSADELTRVQNFLNARLHNRTLGEVRILIQQELTQARDTHDLLRQQALELSQRVLPELELEISVQGASHLFDQPEFADLQKLRALMRTIAEKETILRLVDQVLDTVGVRVMLGSEHGLWAVLPDLACVGCAWSGPAGYKTAIGLLGPSRMDYGRLVPLVQYATDLFGRFWEQL